MATYEIRLKGCCHESTVIEVSLTDLEHALLARIARMTQDVSEFDCQPTMTITPAMEITE